MQNRYMYKKLQSYLFFDKNCKIINSGRKEQEAKVGKLVGGAQMHQLMEIEHLLKLERTIFSQSLKKNLASLQTEYICLCPHEELRQKYKLLQT